jgi:ABC-type multidrug transport system fused ATPase/permease subunit
MSSERKRARALPLIGPGPAPQRTEPHADGGLGAVLALLRRAWPFVRPLVFGHWFTPGHGVDPPVAGPGRDTGFSNLYAPLLAAALTVAGPLAGWLPATMSFPHGLLYASIAGMTAAMALYCFTNGGLRSAGGWAAIVCAILANLLAMFLVRGVAVGIHTAAVTLLCFAGWMLQFRLDGARLYWRLRLGAHLAWLYALVLLTSFIGFASGLLLTDLVSQSILQAEPMKPAVAAIVGYPDLADGVVATLDNTQRHALKWRYIWIFLAVAVVTLQLGIVIAYYRVWILQQLNQALRIALVERWHQLSPGYHGDHRTGDSIFRIYQDSAQITAVIDRLIGVTSAAIGYVMAIVVVVLLSPWIGLILLSLLAPALAWAGWAMPRMRARSLAARAATSDVTSTVQESFAAIRVIKAYGAEARAQARFEADSIASFNATYRVRMLVAFVTIVMFTITAAFILGSEFLTASWANRGEATFANAFIALVGVSFTVWNLAAFSWTRGQVHTSAEGVRAVLRQWLTVQDIAMGLRRAFDILDSKPDITDRPDALPFEGVRNDITFAGVTFGYTPGHPVVNDVSFTATPGTITAIVGPTGSGKSTLLSLLLRLHDPAAGAIQVDGRDLRDFQVQSLRSKVAIALQENMLFAMSLRDNIRYVTPDASDAEVRRAAQVACMDDFIDALPEGIDTVLGDRGSKLSTGQRQRLSIARAVVRDTPILILDEPTAALDAATERHVMRNLAEWGRGRVIFLITHRLSTIRNADNILYVDAGAIIERGDHASLMQIVGGRYRAFVDAESAAGESARASGGAP